MTPWDRYQADLAKPNFSHDPAQEAAVRALQDLYLRLEQSSASVAAAPRGVGRLLQRLKPAGAPPPVKGLYLWGGVGRGKTYLMDTFFDCLPFAEKQRMHFHRFMHMVHGRLKEIRNQQYPLRLVAREFAGSTRVLCFDEFFVSDITDAMLLGGLLEELFRQGLTLVATSNIPPKELYRNGLQRERFLPAIRLLEQHTDVMNVDGGTDYRLRYLEQAEIFHAPLDAAAERMLEEEFEQLAPEPGKRDASITIEGRRIPVRAIADDVVWFDFDAICDGPRSQTDYIEVAREFHTVLLSGVPVLDITKENQARRFISLVDEFYDRNVKLIITAAAEPESLYQGKRLKFEFERTVSRMQEMQSREYLGRAHRA
ncbi:MAG: cell division protein ZapE [Ectothiorhodospiraceae bacterium]|nr:cell division protein ZapE [Ectothiorhodospiraceae bacterium]